MIGNMQESLQALINAGADSQKNLFYVDIKPVENQTSPDMAEGFWDGVSVRVEGFKLPDITKKTTNLEFQDTTIPKVVSGETFKKTLTLNIRSDFNYDAYKYFQGLLVNLKEHAAGSSFARVPAFYFNIWFHRFDTSGNKVEKPMRVFYNCELTSLGALDFSYSSTGTQTFPLNFIYSSLSD